MIPIGMSAGQGKKATPRYCPVTSDAPPKALASNPAYVQFAVSILDLDPGSAGPLNSADFRVSEGQQRLPIAFFKADREVPQSVGILIDRSASMVSKLAIVRRAVSLLAHTLSPCDDVFVYAFGGEPMIVEPFTLDRSEIDERLTHVKAVGGTPLFDSLNHGLAAMKDGHYPGKSLIIFTDGVRASFFGDKIDNASKTSRDEVILAMQADATRVFIVGVGRDGTDWATSGDVVNAGNLKEFTQASETALYLIHGTPDPSARAETVGLAGNADPISRAIVESKKYVPLAPDSSDLQNAVVSIASQIDHGYTIGVLAPSAPGPSDAIKIDLVSSFRARVFARRVNLAGQP